MKYLVITYSPSRQGWLAPIPEKYIAVEFEAPDIDILMDRLQVPLGGWVKVVPVSAVTTVKARIVNEVAK